MMKNTDRRGFLFNNGGYLAYIVPLIISLFAAVSHFSTGSFILGLLSLAAFIILQKAVFGLVLLVGRKSSVWANMPMSLRKAYSKTYYRCQNPLPGTAGKMFALQLLWLALGLIPIVLVLLRQV